MIGLGESFSTPVPLEVNEDFRKAATNVDVGYTGLYEMGLEKSHYNFVLNDLAFFQFSIAQENHVRYAYYPNPFISGNVKSQEKLRQWREMEAAELLDREEVNALIASLTTSTTIPLIRYENAPSQYKMFDHPCSHFHIGLHSENRWAVSRLLTPFAFTLWIVKQYYRNNWRTNSDVMHEHGNPFETSLIDERSECRVLGQELFSQSEATSIHLG
jgi:hypothetical protein